MTRSVTYEVAVPDSEYSVLPGLPQAMRRLNHALPPGAAPTHTVTLPLTLGNGPLLVFVNGLGPYPPDTYQVQGPAFTLLAHALHEHDHLTLLF